MAFVKKKCIKMWLYFNKVLLYWLLYILKCLTNLKVLVKEHVRGAFNKFQDFFCIGI